MNRVVRHEHSLRKAQSSEPKRIMESVGAGSWKHDRTMAG